MARIAVLGSSFGGLTAAFEIKRLLGGDADVTVISDDDRFVFLPSLPWLIMGWREPADITLRVPEILKRKGISFVHEAVKGVDADASRVQTASGEVPYDHLVISTGPFLSFGEIPGLGPDTGHTECTFTLGHGLKTRERLRTVFETPGPVVIGSSQMVSCFGPSYELAFEIDAELRRRKMRHKVPMLYLTSEPYLGHMGVGGLGNSKRFFEDEFAERDIKSLTSQSIEEVVPGEIRLKDGSKLPFKMAMIAPPFKGVPAVSSLGNPRGFIPAEKNYRHPKHRNIFTIGVAVAIAPPEVTPVPTGVPKTGFMTVKMAKTAAAAIYADIKGTPPPAEDVLDVMCLMDMGNTAAFMKASPVLPPRQESVTRKGIWARWLKVGFEKYFLWKIRNGMSNLP